MVARWVHVLALAISCNGESSLGHSELSAVERLQALKEKVLRQQERLESLEHAKERNLLYRSSPYQPSIYGEYSSDTRAYTPQENFEGALSQSWLVLCGMIAFFMQAGLTVFRAGLARKEYVQHCTLLSLVDVCIGILAWWLFGWAFALGGPYEVKTVHGTWTGESVNWWQWQEGDSLRLISRFAGSQQFAGTGFLAAQDALGGQQEPSPNIAKWFFRGATVLMATSIATGGLAERARPYGAAIASFLLTAVVFPIPVAWNWGRGWLNVDLISDNGTGAFDFAGSGVIHMSGGVAALMGAVIVQSREGRFSGDSPFRRKRKPTGDEPPPATSGKPQPQPPVAKEEDFVPHSHMLVVLGTFILWFGWYGFNCGSTLAMTTGLTNGIEYGFQAAVVAMNTSISAATAGLVVFLVRAIIDKGFRVTPLCNGILAGLVSISAACSTVETGSACAIGAIGGLMYLSSSSSLRSLRIDDPFDAYPIHGACGAWGVMAAALFDWGKGFDTVHGQNGFRCLKDTACKKSVGGDFVLQNLVLVVSVQAWVAVLSAIILGILRVSGHLRAPDWEGGQGNQKGTPDPGLDAESCRSIGFRPAMAYAMEAHPWDIAKQI